jgi:hypothetical protein
VFLESILKVREDTLSIMLANCYAIIDKAVQVENTICQVKDKTGKCTTDSECRSMILGSLLIKLIALKLYPERKTGKTIVHSVQGLRNIFQEIKIQTIDSHDLTQIRDSSRYTVCTRQFLLGKGITSHEICGRFVNLAEMCTQVIGQMPSPTLDSHRTHMDKQARK